MQMMLPMLTINELLTMTMMIVILSLCDALVVMIVVLSLYDDRVTIVVILSLYDALPEWLGLALMAIFPLPGRL